MPFDEEELDPHGECRHEIHRLRLVLQYICDLEPEPYPFPADWQAQVDGCADCQRYKGHPVQQGICDTHRQPLWARERHDKHQEVSIGYRAKELARNGLHHPG